MRRHVLAAMAVAAAAIALPAQASADTSLIFFGHTMSGAALPCATQTDGVRACNGDYTGSGADMRLKSFDNTPLEAHVTLPPAPTTGTDGNYPVVVLSHGWGSSAKGSGGDNLTNNEYYSATADTWAKNGYAVLQLTARGFGDSCGKAAQQTENPQYYQGFCSNGYIRLDDARYEARDVQWAIGLLVDEGIVDPARIGVTGESYGGGVSLELATLKDRIMNTDGTLSPWTSPGGTPLSIAAAAPVIPWSDLVNSLMPNGRTLDYQVTSPTADLSPIGVEKSSFVSGLYALGQSTGTYAPPGSDPDLTSWFGTINAGEPYDANPQANQIVTEIAQYHSPYYLLDGKFATAQEPPAPLLIANGFTDDLFPVDEAVRYYNLEQSLYPSDPIELVDGDFGHARGQNKPGDKSLLANAIQNFFDHYVKGTGGAPPLGATATTETCPASVPSGVTYSAPTWAALHPGEVDYKSAPAQTIFSGAGDPSIATQIDPIVGGGACATVSATDQGNGVATYRLPAATGSGYTLLGAPTAIGDLNVTGDQAGSFAFIAARLWDVNTSTSTETLVARGLYRIDGANPDGLQVFQLHPGAWHFAAGHIAKLELLGQDSPYARTSNGQFSITVTNLQLRLPVHEAPGSSPTVNAPLPVVTPQPHPASGSSSTGGGSCTATRPFSRLNKRHVHASRRLLLASGTAGESQCAQASASTRRRERVVAVYVMIYRPASGRRCRFLRPSGKLTAPRSCARPIEFLARGTAHWTLRLHVRIPPGRGYLVRSDAVDGFGHHQRHSAASVVRVRVL
jgi:dienelactone hydrolase